MNKTQELVQELPELNVGVVGHIDHGKTTLLSKLTGKFTDTHSEELKRGITIKLGYAETVIYKCGNMFSNKEMPGQKCEPLRYVSFIDAPGHEMLMATMLSGAAIIDAAILVIAANEGIKPQTREHLMALQAKKIKDVIVIQNKIDLVSKEEALKNHDEIKNFLMGTMAENSPVIPVSAQQEINLDKVFMALAGIEIPERDTESDPFFLVARSFDVNRPGIKVQEMRGGVLGGILKRGKLKIGDEIEIKPGISTRKHNSLIYKTLTTEILSLHKGNRKVGEVVPGASISIETSLDPFLTKADSLTGCVVSLKGRLPEIQHGVKLKTILFDEVFGLRDRKKVEPLKTKELMMLSINTTITVGVVERISKNETEFSLNIPIVAMKGDNAGIARNIEGHWRLVGLGEVL